MVVKGIINSFGLKCWTLMNFCSLCQEPFMTNLCYTRSELGLAFIGHLFVALLITAHDIQIWELEALKINLQL